jgi:hypothetical protein
MTVSRPADDRQRNVDTAGDIEIVNEFTFNLRAERSGSDPGRIYTVTHEATDACGNAVVVSTGVVVPLSRP